MTSFLSKYWFRFIHTNFLVYNICWEDSDVDRHLLQINPETSLLTITSAGCNVLNYLLESPNSIHSVDINPKQTALLELKTAFIKYGDYELFFDFFGNGKSVHYETGYQIVRTYLSPASRKFWDNHIDYFDPKGRGLFYQGGSGIFARFLNRTINRKNLHNVVKAILSEPSREQRAELYAKIKKKLWNGPEKNLWKSSFMLSLAGIPEKQRDAIGDINLFMQQVLHNVFVKQNPETNYYWRVYLEGAFTKNYCPEYLKEENFELMRSNIDRLIISTSGIHDLLDQTNQTFSHVVLLDYMDWLVGNDEAQLIIDWDHILTKTTKGSKILFRTSYSNSDFLPDLASQKMKLRQVDPDWIKLNDKVGTYTTTWLGEIR